MSDIKAIFDHDSANKAGAWTVFEKQVQAHMERWCVNWQVKVKPTGGYTHFPQVEGRRSTWAFVAKRIQVGLSSYPAVLNGDADWHEETNGHRGLYWSGLQAELHSIMSANFEEYEKAIFEKFNPERDIGAEDAQRLGMQGTRVRFHEDEGDGDHYGAGDDRWPYGTYAFLAIKERYQGQKSVHVFTLMAEYNHLRKQVASLSMEEWAKKIKAKKHELDKAKEGQDAEYLDCMQLLLDMSEVPAWKEWAQTDATKEGVAPGYYTVEKLFERAITMNDMRSASNNSVKLAEAGAKLALSNATAAGNLGNGTGGFKGFGKHELICQQCNAKFRSNISNHKYCAACFKKTKSPTEADLAQHSSTEKGKDLHKKLTKREQRQRAIDNSRRKDKQRRGDRTGKAGGHTAQADSSASSSASDEEEASASLAHGNLGTAAETTALIQTALAKANKATGSKKRMKSNQAEGCKIGQHKHFPDSDEDKDDDSNDKCERKRQRNHRLVHFSVGASGAKAGAFMAKAESARASMGSSKKSSTASTSVSVHSVYFIVEPPIEMPQTIPEYFMIGDSGATHHMQPDECWLAYKKESYMKVTWGKDGSYSRAIAIGHMVFMTYDARTKQPKPILATTGQEDTLLVPDVSRPLAALNRWAAQGHTPHLKESNPGLIGHNNSFFIPFCYEPSTGYFLVPAYPPPNRAVFQIRGNVTLPVVDLNEAINNGSYSPIYMNKLVGMAAVGEANDETDMILEDIQSSIIK